MILDKKKKKKRNMANNENHSEVIEKAFLSLNENFLKRGISMRTLQSASVVKPNAKREIFYLHYLFFNKTFIILILALVCGALVKMQYMSLAIKTFHETRCFVPNNYLIWEFTRPISDCDYCKGINTALILSNLSRKSFEPYAYSSQPIVVKNAISHWQASKVFNLTFFQNLYENIDGAYESIEEECQFLHFKSNFSSLREVFAMSKERAENYEQREPWYVGWKNCHPQVLDAMKRFYKPPHFLPEDAEIPSTNYVFMGYEQGAIMHLDYIPRLMWQGQILGNKRWTVAPTPECDDICKSFNFTVNAGDIVLLDTRIWYHGTYVLDGQFSLTVASEYG